MMKIKSIYRISFVNQGKVYEIYAREINQGALFGFIEVSQLIFGESSGFLVDPAEERLKAEYKHVTRTYIPLHQILKIDEVEKEGIAKIVDMSEKNDNIMPFPIYTQNQDPKKT